MMKRFKIYLAYLLLLSFSGCTEELVPDRGYVSDEVTVIIRVPGPSRGNTRAITQGSAADNAVTRIDILMFDATTKLYTGRIYSNTITGTGNTKTFTVRMPRGSYDLMVLANSKDIIDAATLIVGTTPKTGTAASADRLLIASLPNPGLPYVLRAWNANPSSPDFKPFPMWGEVLNFSPETSDGTMAVNLIRALAKINVRFANQAARDKLAINSIALFNYNSGGYLVSRGYNQSATNVSQHAPDAMTTTAGHGYNNAIPYTAGTGLNVSVDEIFLFEVSAAASTADRNGAVALIIGGYYNGSATVTYYRIDIADSSGNYFDIIRNHYYDIMITAINGPGYSTAREAADAKPFNILTQINAWDESGMNNHTYDGRYQITVDFNNVRIHHTGLPSQPLRIYTDVPAGWTIEVPTASNWISVTPTSYTNSVVPFISTTVQITCSPNAGTASRTGSFFIVAGVLRKEITVTQAMVPGISIGGIYWAETNVDSFGTFAANPQDAGMLYQWSRPNAWASTGTVSGWDATLPTGTAWVSGNDPCPVGWRIPTDVELQSLYTTSSIWVVDWNSTGVSGRLFGIAPNQIFLPAVGQRIGATGTLDYASMNGYYWSNTWYSTTSAWSLAFSSGSTWVTSGYGSNYGFSIRCVAE